MKWHLFLLLAVTWAPRPLLAQMRWHSAGLGVQRGGDTYFGESGLAQLRQNHRPEALPWLTGIPDTLQGRSPQLNGGGELNWSQALTASFKEADRRDEVRLALLLQNFQRNQSFDNKGPRPGQQYFIERHSFKEESQVLRLMVQYAKFTKPLIRESVVFYGLAGLDGGISLRNQTRYLYQQTVVANYQLFGQNGVSGTIIVEDADTEHLAAKPRYLLGATAAVGLELLLFKRHDQPFINLGAEYQYGYSHWWVAQGGSRELRNTSSVMFTMRVCRVRAPRE
jgi:hypothetical protein